MTTQDVRVPEPGGESREPIKAYIGDSVYADIENGMVKLTTENGLGPSNTIYLEREVVEGLWSFIKRHAHRILVALLVLLCLAAPAWAAPNILLIIADDLGWPFMGFMGHPSILTPNLDQLAAEGLTFPNGQVTYPACDQSLRSIARGFHNRDVDRTDPSQILLPKALEAHGYTTVQQGKWRDGDAPSKAFSVVLPGVSETGRSETSMQRLFSAISHAQEPWFVWWAPTIPHAPHNAPEPYRSMYPDGTDLGDIPLEFASAGTRSYMAMVSWLDARVGEVRAHLDAIGALDHTLIVFLSDNGAGIRQSKGAFREAGMRTPIILRGPGVTPRVSGDLAASIDLYPTFVELAGGSVGFPDARSLVSAMEGAGHRQLWFSNLIEGSDYAVRDVAGRKVYTTKAGAVTRCSDLVADPYEQVNKNGTPFCAQAVADLLPALNAWRLRQ